jgi:poly(3-hydroxybutyrate) depolymerase
MPETMEFWRHLHNCTGQDWHGLPHRDGTGATHVALISWTGCSAGGSVQLLRVQGGGHQLPTLAPDAEPKPGNLRNHDIETAEAVWRFFATGKADPPASP